MVISKDLTKTGWAEITNEKTGNVRASRYTFFLSVCASAKIITILIGSTRYNGKLSIWLNAGNR